MFGVVSFLAGLALVGPWWSGVLLGVGCATVWRPFIGAVTRRSWCIGVLIVANLVVVGAAFEVRVVELKVMGQGGQVEPILCVSVRPRALVRRGDVVVRRVEACETRGRCAATVDRVLAVDGDAIEIFDGVVGLNGTPVSGAMLPLGLLDRGVSVSHRLMSGEVAVIPTLARWRATGDTADETIAEAISRRTVIDERDIFGRVLLLRRGMWRWRVCP